MQFVYVSDSLSAVVRLHFQYWIFRWCELWWQYSEKNRWFSVSSDHLWQLWPQVSRVGRPDTKILQVTGLKWSRHLSNHALMSVVPVKLKCCSKASKSSTKTVRKVWLRTLYLSGCTPYRKSWRRAAGPRPSRWRHPTSLRPNASIRRQILLANASPKELIICWAFNGRTRKRESQWLAGMTLPDLTLLAYSID